MGWLNGIIQKIRSEDAVDLTFIPDLKLPDLEDGPPVRAEECYVELYIESLRLERARKFATRFHGIVYAFVTLSAGARGNVEFAALTKPQRIADLAMKDLGKVITLSKQLMSPVPWRGGRFGLELGLFSVKSGNILTPLTDFIARISDTAGIGFLGAVGPFVPLITGGMDLLAGQSADCALEVGIDTDLTLRAPTACAIIAAPRDTFEPAQLSIDPSDHRLLLNGKPLDKAYCVFSIRTTAEKTDFGQVPELRQRYSEFENELIAGSRERAETALEAFRRTALVSPDLISSDARRLIELASARMKEVLGRKRAARFGIETGEAAQLADLPLYGKRRQTSA